MTSEGQTRAQQVEFAERIALRQLAARARSEHELREALSRKLVRADVQDDVMVRMKELGYVDDDAFAQSLTASRVRHSHRGRARIRQELQHKGIGRDAVDAVMQDLDPAEEWAAAREFATRRARALSGLEHHVAMRRLTGALARRGFTMDIVLAVSREVLAELADG